ncbi:hypothetical protein WR25_02946 [Diploscapter pachys]|uniref:Uncharacterized protein n=1 Tax=Diploscapter pachys TaxID=2018661 RepID=A0A2A2M603_9BILA|nr:hypothetical protein WR25_02946 [Diploscapter pachys]
MCTSGFSPARTLAFGSEGWGSGRAIVGSGSIARYSHGRAQGGPGLCHSRNRQHPAGKSATIVPLTPADHERAALACIIKKVP